MQPTEGLTRTQGRVRESMPHPPISFLSLCPPLHDCQSWGISLLLPSAWDLHHQISWFSGWPHSLCLLRGHDITLRPFISLSSQTIQATCTPEAEEAIFFCMPGSGAPRSSRALSSHKQKSSLELQIQELQPSMDGSPVCPCESPSVLCGSPRKT